MDRYIDEYINTAEEFLCIEESLSLSKRRLFNQHCDFIDHGGLSSMMLREKLKNLQNKLEDYGIDFIAGALLVALTV